jgi:AraC-like DNA-binding protein
MGSGQCLDPDIAASQQLIFHDGVAHVDRDPQVLADRLAQHYSLLDFGARPGFEAEFLHRTSTAQAGQLLLSCGFTTPIMGTIGAREGIGSVNLLFSGAVTYGDGTKEYRVDTGCPLFFAPSDNYNYLVDHYFNGVVFDLDLNRLRQTAAAMVGLGVSERRFASDLEVMRAIQPRSREVGELLQVLCRAFRMLDHQDLRDSKLLQHLQVDDLIYRTLALILSPRLRKLLAADSGTASGRTQLFDELLQWIDVHLQSPINLTQLETISGYSRRNLQLAFQQRFGCGPIQWIRQQRLERVRRDLLAAEPGETIAMIAARYGFSSTSVFSRDFRASFGLRPSELLREARRFNPEV